MYPLLLKPVYKQIIWNPETAIRVGYARTLTAERSMARWPRRTWTTLYTYGTIFIAFPLLAYVALAWVRGWPPF